MATKRTRSKVARQKLALRDNIWPELDEDTLWKRATSDGWLSVPRAMPLLLRIMDSLSKGKPLSATYFDLWCRTYDDSFVIANKDREMAFSAGFTGERAVRTWANRMTMLADLGFISVQSGPSGPLSYVLLMNPYHVVHKLREKGQINEGLFNALNQRMVEIGADDLTKLAASAKAAAKEKAPATKRDGSPTKLPKKAAKDDKP